jgi:hypothetical protein
MRKLNVILLVCGFLLPAAISLYFAWSVWIGNKLPAIAKWRLFAFRWGLVSALAAMGIFSVTCAHMLGALENARGIWLVANWVGIVLWVTGFTGALAGTGRGRVTLFLWGILMFAGVFGISSAMIP